MWNTEIQLEYFDFLKAVSKIPQWSIFEKLVFHGVRGILTWIIIKIQRLSRLKEMAGFNNDTQQREGLRPALFNLLANDLGKGPRWPNNDRCDNQNWIVPMKQSDQIVKWGRYINIY